MRFGDDVIDAILVLCANNEDRTTCVFCLYSLCFTLLHKTCGMTLIVCKKISSRLCKNCISHFFKSNLYYTRRITLKRVTSCGAHLRGLAPGQHSSEEMSQRWRVVGDTVSIFDRPGNRTPDSRTDSVQKHVIVCVHYCVTTK